MEQWTSSKCFHQNFKSICCCDIYDIGATHENLSCIELLYGIPQKDALCYEYTVSRSAVIVNGAMNSLFL